MTGSTRPDPTPDLAASKLPREPDWPEGSTPVDQFAAAAALKRYEAELAAAAVPDDEGPPSERPIDAELRQQRAEVDQEFFEHYYAVFSGSITRAQTAAETIQKASAAIGTLYAGAYTVAFSVTDRPLPGRGVIPLLFLGLSVVASTFYLAWRRDDQKLYARKGAEAEAVPVKRRRAWTEEYVEIIDRITTARVGALRAGVLALGLGLAFLPAPFINVAVSPPPDSVTPVECTAVGEPAGQYPDLPTDPELAAIVLQAQVDEVAACRAAERALSDQEESFRMEWLPDGGWAWLVLVGLGLIAVFLAWSTGSTPQSPGLASPRTVSTAVDPATLPRQLDELAEHRDHLIRYLIATNPTTWDTTLTKLENDLSRVVRRAASASVAHRADTTA